MQTSPEICFAWGRAVCSSKPSFEDLALIYHPDTGAFRVSLMSRLRWFCDVVLHPGAGRRLRRFASFGLIISTMIDNHQEPASAPASAPVRTMWDWLVRPPPGPEFSPSGPAPAGTAQRRVRLREL